jgi:hypothetical protein
LYLSTDSYQKEHPPKHIDGGPLQTTVSLELSNINNVDELKMEYTLRFKITISWFDPRIQFKNLRQQDKDNIIGPVEMQQIWLPFLMFSNSNDGEGTVVDDRTFLTVQRVTTGYPNGIEHIHEETLYDGASNPLILERYYSIKLHCPFRLEMFPFDHQECPIEMHVPFNLNSHMELMLGKVVTEKNITITQYRY